MQVTSRDGEFHDSATVVLLMSSDREHLPVNVRPPRIWREGLLLITYTQS